MAASLITRCTSTSSRTLLSRIHRSSLFRLSTKPTDGDTSGADVEKHKGEVDPQTTSSGERALAGFAKALEKARMQAEDVQADDSQRRQEPTVADHTTFAAMLRHSKLIQTGDYAGRMVVGTVFEVVGDDLYIDFGGKFHSVCPRPKLNAERYHRGVKVKLQLTDPEMSSSFLGSEKHVTLLEADAILIGLRRQPLSAPSPSSSP